MRRLRKFAALAPDERRLALEAAVVLTLALAVLALVPFRRIAAWLGEPVGGGERAVRPPDARHLGSARQIGRAVERAARHLPWPALCLPQTIAAQAMLRRRGIASTAHFGMALSEAPDPRRMRAHAWLTVGDTAVVGGRGDGGFAVLARFSHEPAAGQPAP